MNTNPCYGSSPPRPALWELRVLIVNPDLSSANTILHELEACGATGIVVENFEQALAFYSEVHPNVLITKLSPSNPHSLTMIDETQKLLTGRKEHPLAIAITDFPWMLDQTCSSAQTFHHHLFEPLDVQSLISDVKKIIKERISIYSNTNRTGRSLKQKNRKTFANIAAV
jgi:DNA-binding NtrC family response regulator